MRQRPGRGGEAEAQRRGIALRAAAGEGYRQPGIAGGGTGFTGQAGGVGAAGTKADPDAGRQEGCRPVRERASRFFA